MAWVRSPSLDTPKTGRTVTIMPSVKVCLIHTRITILTDSLVLVNTIPVMPVDPSIENTLAMFDQGTIDPAMTLNPTASPMTSAVVDAPLAPASHCHIHDGNDSHPQNGSILTPDFCQLVGAADPPYDGSNQMFFPENLDWLIPSTGDLFENFDAAENSHGIAESGPFTTEANGMLDITKNSFPYRLDDSSDQGCDSTLNDGSA